MRSKLIKVSPEFDRELRKIQEHYRDKELSDITKVDLTKKIAEDLKCKRLKL